MSQKRDPDIDSAAGRVAIHSRWGNAELERRARKELAQLQAKRLRQKARELVASANGKPEEDEP